MHLFLKYHAIALRLTAKMRMKAAHLHKHLRLLSFSTEILDAAAASRSHFSDHYLRESSCDVCLCAAATMR
jgi:hypothetical protein